MNRRLALAAAILLAAAPVSGASAARPETLDGQRRTTYAYAGELAGPTVYAGMIEAAEPGVYPTPRWCRDNVTCDKTRITLALPSGRQSGRLVVELKHKSGARMHLGVYDAQWREIPPQDVACCDQDRLVVAQLPKGTYHVVVFDDAGGGWFETSVSWKANRPHRAPSRD